MLTRRIIVRRTIAMLTVIAACIAGAIYSTPLRAGARGTDADLSALQQRVDRLEALTERVEAIAAIKRLQHAYGHYAELGLWHDFADLFADSGIGYYTQGALDREGIRSLFLKEVGQGRLGLADGRIYPHISMQPVVTVAPDGRSANGRWHIMAMLGGYGKTASWAGGVYDNQYVRENGIWKFKEVHYLAQYSGRYEDPGWTATKTPTPFHDDASRVGRPIADVPDPPRPSTPPTLALLARRMADLSTRARRLGDEIEITNLQHAYGYYVDRKMWDDVADLFVAGGTMELGAQGVYVGPNSIRRALPALDAPATATPLSPSSGGLAEGEINDHVHLQTIVTVLPDGRTARARGTEIGMTGTSAGRPLWSQSIYENEFVREGGAWKFKSMHVYPRFIVDAEKGWAKDAQPAPGPSRAVPPDRPPTASYAIYPRFSIPPFHFDHPVTGRPPQYPEGTNVAARSRSITAAPATPVKTTAALASLIASTELSIARSKAYHAAENLVTAYGYYSDEFALDDAANLFSRDGSQELPYVGTYVGRERIRQSLKRRYPNGRPQDGFTVHQIVQPVIHVSADARSAKIRARAFQLGTTRAGDEGSWISGIYENTAIDEDGTWKLSAMDLDYVWQAPSHGGWVRVKTPPTPPDVPMAREFPPDRPLRGPIAPPFPKVRDVPFHYANPVSGRVPPVLLP